MAERVAEATATIDKIEQWFTQFGWKTVELKGDEAIDAARTIGLFLVVGPTGLMMLLATLFNLASGVVAGLRVKLRAE